MAFASMLSRFSPNDAMEDDEVIESTSIPGLHWIRTYGLASTERSRIVLPLQGQGNFSVVYHAEDFSESLHGGYDHYGIHIGQVDVLTFLATDGRQMRGHFVDCRAESGTLHREQEVLFVGDPDKALVVDRGIAHIFDNLKGMVTLNQMRLFVEFGNSDFSSGVDVINVPRDTPVARFPRVRVNRFRAPNWICRLAVKAQRLQLRHGLAQRNHPFKFRVGDKVATLVREK